MSEFTKEQVTKLVEMQCYLNSMIAPNWSSRGWAWDTAIVDECMELLNHIGWKWWSSAHKSKVYATVQVQLEVIDILHFVLSKCIEDMGTGPDAVSAMTTRLNQNPITLDPANLKGHIERAFRLGTHHLHLPTMLHLVDLTPNQVLDIYTKKWVLNRFRQDHGYKSGTYDKMWNVSSTDGYAPMEDNEVLEHICTGIVEGGVDSEDLYQELEDYYDAHLVLARQEEESAAVDTSI